MLVEHQAPRKAAHSLQKEVGQNIQDKKRDNRIRDRDPSCGGSREGGEVSKHQETLSPVGLWGSFGILEGNITGRKKIIEPTDYTPNCNSQWRRSSDAHVHQQQAGAEQGRAGYMLRVRTEPACPEDNLRELTRLHTGPSPRQRQRGRWATARAERRGAISTPDIAPSTKL